MSDETTTTAPDLEELLKRAREEATEATKRELLNEKRSDFVSKLPEAGRERARVLLDQGASFEEVTLLFGEKKPTTEHQQQQPKTIPDPKPTGGAPPGDPAPIDFSKLSFAEAQKVLRENKELRQQVLATSVVGRR
jgi:hypothetical protein